MIGYPCSVLVWAQPRQAHNIEKTYLSLPSLGKGTGSQACYQTVDRFLGVIALPAISAIFFRPVFWTINLVLLMNFKQITLEMQGWSHFKHLFRTFPIFCEFVQKLVSYDMRNLSYFMGILFFFTSMK